MKKRLSLLLVFALVLSMVTSAFAAEGMESGEQPPRVGKPNNCHGWNAG